MCGCNRKTQARSASNNVRPGNPNANFRVQNNAVSPQERSVSGLNSERRKVEKIRRQAIANAQANTRKIK